MNLLWIASQLAAEHGVEHGDIEPHVANWWGIGAKYAETPALGLLSITFLVFVGGLALVLRPRLAILLENRADTVRKAIQEATHAKELAETRARDAEQKLQALEGETKKIRADFEAQGQEELARLEKLAKETAARISRDAEDTIQAEIERARQVLRAEASRLALEMAEEKIRAALSSSDDARLQKSLVDGLTAPMKAARTA